MNGEDVHKLFDLLEQLYQGKKRPRDEITVAIWEAVLKPWPYKQVRGAAIQRARVNRYFPDPSELAEYLPAAAMETSPARGGRDDAVEKLRRQWYALRRARREARVAETAGEARGRGMSSGQWLAELEAAGLALEGTP